MATVTIRIMDDNPERYTLKPNSLCLGRMYDNIAEGLVVLFPQFEIQNQSYCTMIVYANGTQIDSISVDNGIPVDITSSLSQYKNVQIGFIFEKNGGYTKNSEAKCFYFADALKPVPFVPVDPTQQDQFRQLAGEAFADVDWAANENNVLEFKNINGAVVKSIELSPFVQEQADLAEDDTTAETYVKNKYTRFLVNDGEDGTSPYATQDYVTNVNNLVNYSPTSAFGAVAFSNNYEDLSSLPKINNVEVKGSLTSADFGLQDSIPDLDEIRSKANSALQPNDNITELTNNAGYITKDVNDLTYYTLTSGLAPVALSNEYSDLDNKPTSTSDFTNDGDGASPFATEAYVAQNGGKIDSISVNNVPQTIDANKNVDITVPTNTVQTNTVFAVSNDDATLTNYYVDLGTQATSSAINSVPLANDTTAGLMSYADYNQIRDNTSRIEALEGKTTRLLYTDTKIGSDTIIVSTTTLTAGSVLKARSILNGTTLVADTTLSATTTMIINDKIASDSTITNGSTINSTPIPTAADINAFAISQGFSAPFEGVAVVTDETYHIWHYYENNSIGWRDDGVDTVSQFTNETPGLILGSATDGKVYAETDGTGSLYGWSALKGRVSDLENNYVPKTRTVAGQSLETDISTATLQTALSDSTHRFVSDTDISTWNAKQDALESGVNIKTINGNSVLGSGNLAINAYQPFPNTWTTDGTMEQLMQDIETDTNAVKGMAYLGEITCSDLPFIGNADVVIEIMDGSGTNKVIVATINSGNVAPYYWRYTYWVISDVAYTSGWISFLPTSTKYGASIEAVGTTLSLKDQSGSVLSTTTTQDTTYETINNDYNPTTNKLATANDLPIGFTTQEIEAICDDVLYPALPAPTNVSATGTTVSFDEVAGAQSYEVFANGNSIGEYVVGGDL